MKKSTLGLWVSAFFAMAMLVGGVRVMVDAWLFSRSLGCAVSIQEQVKSPDGNSNAVIFSKECGATTDFNTQISVCPSNKTFDAADCPPFLITAGKTAISVKWIGETNLLVRVPPATIFKMEENSRDTQIKYVRE